MTRETRGIPATGTCEICKKKDVNLNRTYFNYDLKCECHSPNHFDLVDHCKDCVPENPKTTNVILNTNDFLLSI